MTTTGPKGDAGAFESADQAFGRGEVAGRIETRLAGIDAVIVKINEALGALAIASQAQMLELQRLADLAASNARHDKNQDAKLRDVREAAHASTERISWVVGGILAVLGIIFTLWLTLN